MPTDSAHRSSLRFVHATDIHVVPVNHATEAFARALSDMGDLDPAPDFLVTGGDHIGDALEKTDRAEVVHQWDLYRDVLSRHAQARVFNNPAHLRDDYWRIPYAWAHRDVFPLLELLGRHNARQCVSGHISTWSTASSSGA